MITITANNGTLILWRERKLITDKLFAPDNFDKAVLESITQAEADTLQAQWDEEERVSNLPTEEALSPNSL